MPVIRYRYNYGNVLLSSHGVVMNTHAMCGNTIWCTCQGGAERNLPFGGFTRQQRLSQFEPITMHHINAITYDATGLTGWIDVQGPLQGITVEGRAYLVLDDTGMPCPDKNYHPSPATKAAQVVNLSCLRK